MQGVYSKTVVMFIIEKACTSINVCFFLQMLFDVKFLITKQWYSLSVLTGQVNQFFCYIFHYDINSNPFAFI